MQSRLGRTSTKYFHLLSALLPCLLFLAPVCHVTHAKAIPAYPQLRTPVTNRSQNEVIKSNLSPGSESDYIVWSPDYESLVEAFKAKILSKLGFGNSYLKNSGISKMHKMSTGAKREKIKEFMRRLRQKQGESVGTESEVKPADEQEKKTMKTTLYYSKDPSTQISLSSSSEIAPLRILTFQTNLKHPAKPFHELFITSATLHIRLRQRKWRLQQHGQTSLTSQLRVNIYWLNNSESGIRAVEGDPGTLLKSFIFQDTNEQNVSLDVTSLLSLSIPDFEGNHRTTNIGLTIQEVNTAPHGSSETVDMFAEHSSGNHQQTPRAASSSDNESKFSNSEKDTMNSDKACVFQHLIPGHETPSPGPVSQEIFWTQMSKTLIPGRSDQQQQQPQRKQQYDLGQQSHRIDVDASLEVTHGFRDLRQPSRERRSAPSDECSDKLCCRHTIYISFTDIGWDDWVVSPEGFHAFFCQGDCPAKYKPATTFSQIKGDLHANNPGFIPAPVCAATGYNPLALLYKNPDDELESSEQEDMIVTGCRCR
ncbi:uncharacterized protein LOC101856459 [Aplysia californica]|uniref:Uncharacterized protein LOC101856459 n=1 Tax=Aplysia californica TaxID=6500 RepID=A0ABM0K2H7_APLCA|nr:uncharacterized protein LOC101856459 [Aplysia californica]